MQEASVESGTLKATSEKLETADVIEVSDSDSEDCFTCSGSVGIQSGRPYTQRKVTIAGRESMIVVNHGSSEGHEMLKRNDKYHSIADDVPIPKM